MKICQNGYSRIVILIGKYALKFPRWDSGYLTFLNGCCGNQYEWYWSDYSDRLCPVLWHIPGGFLNIMPRADEFYGAIPENWFKTQCPQHMRIERKWSSFGFLNNRLVAIDYGCYPQANKEK